VGGNLLKGGAAILADSQNGDIIVLSLIKFGSILFWKFPFRGKVMF
jgi:hypothetical protein